MHLQMSLLSLPGKKKTIKKSVLLLKLGKLAKDIYTCKFMSTKDSNTDEEQVQSVSSCTLHYRYNYLRGFSLRLPIYPSPITSFSNVIGGHCNTTGTLLLLVTLNGTDVCIKLRIPRVIQSSCCATHQLTRL